MKDIMVFAHRGASGYAPENTLEAFDMARELGTSALESDVKLTLDRQLVFFHDIGVGKGFQFRPVSLTTLHQLQRLGMQRNIHIPTVEEVFSHFHGEDITWSIDASGPGQGGKLVELAKKYGFLDRLYVASEGYFIKKSWVRAGLYPDRFIWSIREWQINRYGPEKIMQKCLEHGIRTLNFKLSWLTPALHAAITSVGIQMFIWDVHDEARVVAALKYSPAAIYSDYPDIALNIINNK